MAEYERTDFNSNSTWELNLPRYEFDDKGGDDKKSSHAKTITEALRDVKVIREVDVIVAGGGPGGFASAVSAARMGADTILLERYGHLGGMATGGLVNILPNLSDIYGRQYIGGICQELIDRLNARNAASFPEKVYWGSTERNVIDHYRKANMGFFYIRKNKEGEEVTVYTTVIDPEVAKDELNSMVKESGAELLLHSWVTEPIMEGNTVKGVIIESKSGRQAILGKVVIDSTGDGDLLPLAGVETINKIDRKYRIAHLAFCFWLGNVDLKKVDEFKESQPEKYDELMSELKKVGGFTNFFRALLKDQDNVVWFHPHIGCNCQTDVEEMTRIDVASRKNALKTWEFFKKYMPGFEKSFVMHTAPQLGTTGGRRLVGEYLLTEKDMNSDEPFDDTIAVFADNDRDEMSLIHPRTYIPYRSLVPQKTEGLLVACRAFSSEDSVNDKFNLIPHCMCLGQAAGTAAALAVKDNVSVRNVNYKSLREILLKQGAIL